MTHSRNIGDLERDKFWQPNVSSPRFSIPCGTHHMFPVSETGSNGFTFVNKFGRVLNYSTSMVDVTDLATPAAYTWLEAAVTLEAISTDADDNASGDGARTIVVEGLDSDFASQTSTISMNGTDPTTATSESYIRIDRAYVATSGDYNQTATGPAQGVITIRTSSAGATHIELSATPVSLGQSLVARYTIPAGRTGYLFHAAFTTDSNSGKTADFFLWRRENADTVAAPYSPKRIIETFNGVTSFQRSWDVPIKLPEKTDIWVSTVGSGAGTNSSASFDILMATSD